MMNGSEKSFESGPSAESLVDVLRVRSADRPDRNAYTFLAEGETESELLTYAELDRRARSLGGLLQRLGLQGENALLLFPPGLEFVAAFFGCLYGGVTAVPAYPPRPNREQPRLRAIARDARPRVVLTTSAILAKRGVLDGQVPELRGALWLATDEPDCGDAAAWTDPCANGDALAFLQYTSGSTSDPKGVMVTHGNLLHNQEMIRRAFGQDAGSVILGWLPLYHDMGLIGNVLQPLYVGARCILMSPHAFLQRPLRWLEAISRYRATTSGGPNFAYDLCVRRIGEAERRALDLSSWNVAFNGAEPIRPDSLERFAETFALSGFRAEAFFPCYGLAEATLFVSGGERGSRPRVLTVDAAALERHTAADPGPEGNVRQLVGCGRPWMETRALVVDPEALSPCPPGTVGEVWVAGRHVTRGYWRNPEATERDFAARLAGSDEGPFLRTGDLGFVRDGELYVTGRLKDLIILYGRNHYPQDLEATVEASHPDLRLGGAAAFPLEVKGEERLAVVAEVDRRRESAASPDSIAAAVRHAVAEAHAVQVHTLVLIQAGGLPKTSSGKVRRRACRSELLKGRLPVIARSALDEAAAPASVVDSAEIEPPRAEDLPLIEQLRHEAAQVLRIAPRDLPDYAPLTRFGLDSLGAAELRAVLEERLGAAPDWTALLEGADLRRIAAAMAAAPASAPAAGISPVSPASGEAVPLSAGQRGLWVEHRMDPRSAAYNVAAVASLSGPLDPLALERAFRHLTARHPALRATFSERDGEPVQRWSPGTGLSFERIDAGAWSAAEVEAWLADQAHQPFDLERGPLARVHLLARGEEEAVLLLAFHHIAVDFRSLEILVRDLRDAYGAALCGRSLPEPAALQATYESFVARQRELLAGPRGEELWSFWTARLAGGIPPLELAVDRPRPAVLGSGGAAVTRFLSPDLSARIGAAARTAGATPFAFLLAAFQTLLHRTSGAEVVTVGAPAGGRTLAGTSDLVGYLVQTVVIPARIDPGAPWAAVVHEVRRNAAAALAHQDLPFPLLAERLRSRSLQALFVHHRPADPALAAFALGSGGARLALEGLAVESLPLEPRAAKLDLELATAELDGHLCLQLRYSTELFDPATAHRMASQLRVLLAAAVERPDLPVADLPLLSAAERRELAAWNATDTPFPRELCVHQLIEAQADRTPDAPAVSDPGSTVSYAALDRRANQLARRLRRLGVGPGDRVGLCVERSAGMVVALLGVLKTGAAYVPLDPAYPRERLALMIEDAGLAAVVAQPDTLAVLPEVSQAGLPRVDLVADGPALSAESGCRPAVPVPSASLAYVIYTSGSTGRPKGVMIQHRNVANFFAAMDARLGSGPGVWLAVTSISFDISVLELLWTLARGFHVVVHTEPRWAAAGLPARIAEHGVTHLQCTPSLARLLAAEPGALSALGSLRALLLGGEALPADLARSLRDALPEVAIHNLYGPTETTVWSATERVDVPGEPVPIGRPLANTRIFLLDRSLQPVPAGAAGEICIGGEGVTRGYLGRPDLTADRFVPDAWSGEPGARLYRTGDLGRRRPGAPLEFLGRVDHQVKIRGHRIELGEVESVLAACPGVRQSVAVARDGGAGDVRLVAYVVPAGEPPSVPDLRSFAGARLPEALVPSVFVVLEALPLTPNGKIDRRSLPAPAPSRDAAGEPGTPSTPTEERLAAIWADLLGVERVGPEESFFALGGHSLLAARVLARVRTAFGVELPMRTLFERPTVRAVAAFVDAAERAGGGPSAPPLVRSPRPELLPLSFAQQRLHFLAQLEPENPFYNHTSILELGGPLDVLSLRRALAEVVRRHEVLRTTYPLLDNRPVQRIEPPVAVPLPVVDLCVLAPEEQRREVQRQAAAEAQRPFDLERAPVLRALLLRTAPEEHVLFFSFHHIASDAWSIAILVGELAAIYEACGAGRPSPLPDLPVQYADFALWQQSWLQGEVLEEHEAYWRKALGGSPPALRLPTDRPRPARPTYRGLRRTFRWPRELSRSLVDLSRREGVTLFMVLLAAFDVLLQSATGQEDVIVGSAVANRSRVETEGLIGLFLEMLPLRVDLSGNPRFLDLLRRVRDVSLGALAHQDFPLERLAQELRGDGDGTSLFRVAFGVRNAPFKEIRVPGLTIRPVELERETVRFDVTVWVAETPEGLEATWTFSSELFEESTIERMNSRYETLLWSIVSAPETRVDRLSACSDEERERHVREDQAWRDDQAGKLMSIRRKKVIRTEQPQEVAQ